MNKPILEIRPAVIHPIWLRLCHWLNALAMLIMIASGWRIYNASPLFNFKFINELTLGGWLGGALPQLHQMAQVSQVTHHICVEGWSAIGKWGGVPFSLFLKEIGADLNAKYVSFKCADDYYTSIDMATALHPQTIIALTYDGQILPRKYGYPMKLRMPSKLGYKNPKHIQVIEVTNRYPGGYWEDQGYNWFGGS